MPTQLETTRGPKTLARLKAAARPCPSGREALRGHDAPQGHDEGAAEKGPTAKRLPKGRCSDRGVAARGGGRRPAARIPSSAFCHQHSVISILSSAHHCLVQPSFDATIIRCNHHAVLSSRTLTQLMLRQLMLRQRTLRQLMFRRPARGATSHRSAGRGRESWRVSRPACIPEAASLKQHP
jgi:hypothetical protein